MAFTSYFFLRELNKRLWAQKLDYDQREVWHIVDALLDSLSQVKKEISSVKKQKSKVPNMQGGSVYANCTPTHLKSSNWD